MTPRSFLAAALIFTAAAHSHAIAQVTEAGERSFGKCKACHQVGPAARNIIGPLLNGLFGRKAGTVEGYSYSVANKDSTIVWSAATFADYIRDPKARMPGTKMMFTGLRDDQEIAALTTYLQQFDAAGKVHAP